MTWVKTAILSAVGVVLLIGIVLGGYYAADGSVEADVVEKKCSDGGGGGGGGLVGLLQEDLAEPAAGHNSVSVRTTFPVPGIKHTLTDITTDKCVLVNEGNHVRVHIRSERTSIWDRPGGTCIWDTEHGPTGCDR